MYKQEYRVSATRRQQTASSLQLNLDPVEQLCSTAQLLRRRRIHRLSVEAARGQARVHERRHALRYAMRGGHAVLVYREESARFRRRCEEDGISGFEGDVRVKVVHGRQEEAVTEFKRGLVSCQKATNLDAARFVLVFGESSA